jgi:hypothetical protein
LASAESLTYAGPFRIRVAGVTYGRHRGLMTKADVTESLTVQLAVIAEPRTALLAVGAPRATGGTDEGGHDLLPAPSGTAPAPDFLPAGSPQRTTYVRFQPSAPLGTVASSLRGVLPVEVGVGRQDLVSAGGLAKAVGRAFVGGEGTCLTVQQVRPAGRAATAQVVLSGGAGWSYDPATMYFELLGARGRPYGRPTVRMSAVPPAPRPEHVALFAAAAGAPWAALALHPERVDGRRWAVDLSFAAEEDVGPPAKLVLYRCRRVRTEVPFEFRDVPLP